jgi:hypothetical protein
MTVQVKFKVHSKVIPRYYQSLDDYLSFDYHLQPLNVTLGVGMEPSQSMLYVSIP